METLNVTEQQKVQIQQAELKILGELDRLCKKHNIKYIVAYGTLLGAIRHNGFIPWDDDIDVCIPRADFKRFKEICAAELDEQFFYQDNTTNPEYFYLLDKIRLNGTVFKESFVAKYNIHHGVYIDIFPVDTIPDNKLLFNLQYYRFHFYRTGLMAKYLDLGARSGKKKIVMAALKALYAPFPLKYLYKRANTIASRYEGKASRRQGCFLSPYRKKDFFEKKVYEELDRHAFESIEVNIPKDYDTYLSSIYGNYMELPPVSERTTRHSVTALQL